LSVFECKFFIVLYCCIVLKCVSQREIAKNSLKNLFYRLLGSTTTAVCWRARLTAADPIPRKFLDFWCENDVFSCIFGTILSN